MLELIIGIIIGATFAEFWRHVYKFLKRKLSTWMSENKAQE